MLSRIELIRYEITEEALPLIEFARLLRKKATDAESLLWGCLRDRRINRRKFRRQHPFEPYILDFFCADLKLCIELDGGQHNDPEGKRKDAIRSEFLKRHGIRTLRFTNEDMLKYTDSVLGVIWKETK